MRNVQVDAPVKKVEWEPDDFDQVDESLRQLHVTSGESENDAKTWKKMVKMASESIVNIGWKRVIELLTKLTIKSWKSELPEHASLGAHTCMGVYEDLCKLVKMVPHDVLQSEVDKRSSSSPIAWCEGTLLYWIVLLTRYGPLGRCLNHDDESEAVSVAQEVLLSSLASTCISINPNSFEPMANLYASKPMSVWTVLGSLSCAKMHEWHLEAVENHC